MSPPAILSIHDVHPGTLPGVLRTLDVLDAAGARPVTLLVVPGLDWSDEDLAALRGLVASGHRLAGHGWSHAGPPSGLFHRLHALVLSRDQAEHLSLGRADLRRLVARCHAWFGEHGFEPPELYVPPAWALGSLSRADLAELPFRWYETLAGFVDARTGQLRVHPLVGFEADTLVRQVALRLANRVNLALAGALGRAVRIALHPKDLALRLERDVRAVVERDWRYLDVGEALPP